MIIISENKFVKWFMSYLNHYDHDKNTGEEENVS